MADVLDLGDRSAGDTLDFLFTTEINGVLTSLSGGALRCYKGNSNVQTLLGFTLTADFDGINGLNHVRLVTSDGFYVNGEDYHVVIDTGTVSGSSFIGRPVACFSLAKRTLNWAKVANPTTPLNLSATNIDVDQVVASVSGAVASVTGLTPATVHADLDDIQTRLPAALVSGRMDASVGAMAANVLTASALAADAVDEILDDPIGDGTLTMRQALRVLIAGMAGKLSGAATTTITIRNAADSANVIVATVDSDGNRSAVTVTP